MDSFLHVGDHFLDGGRQRSDLGHIRGDDQLGSLTVGDLREGFEGFELDDLLAGISLGQHTQGIGVRLLDGQDRLRFTFGFTDLLFLHGVSLEDR